MKKSLISALLLLSLAHTILPAGAMYARRALSADPGVPMWLKQYNADCTITDQMAVTHVDQTFANETYSRMEGIFIFPLPPNAVVTELALWINGVRVVGSVMEKDSARQAYESVVRRAIDPALLEDMGNNIFKLSVFPIEPKGDVMSERRIEITYAELLPYESGNATYAYNMKSIELSSQPVQRATMSVSLTSQKQILSLTSRTFTADRRLAITRNSDYNYTIAYGDENVLKTANLILNYRFANADYSLTHLTYTPDAALRMPFDSTGDNPYFLLWVTPPLDTFAAKVLPKDVVFVADVSSSMAGTRIIQLRQALNAMVDMLNPDDRFNITAFSTSAQSFATNLTPVSKPSKELAHGYINALSEMGLTNMESALKTALQSTWDPARTNTVIFLTDGRPTWPLSSTTIGILDTVAKYNKTPLASIHTFSVGTDVDSQFLAQIALRNNGFAMRIAQDDSISRVLSGFMQKISFPLIKNVALNFGSLKTYDVYPKTLPSMYLGSQLAVLGRYTNTVATPVTLTGVQRGSPLQLSQTLTFPNKAANNPTVPRVWASAKIDALLGEIKAYGEQTELVNQIKYLGKKYSIITPYTSMLVLEPTLDVNRRLTEDKTQMLSPRFTLLQNTPNPIVASTTIRFSVPKQNGIAHMSLKVFDGRGKLVKTLVEDPTLGGHFMVMWDRTDANGRKVAPGLYLAVLKMGGMREMIAMRVL